MEGKVDLRIFVEEENKLKNVPYFARMDLFK